MIQSIVTHGIVVYVHMAAANSADGVEDFTLDPLDGEVYAYQGTYTYEDPNENADPAAYKWTAVEPEEGTAYKPKLEDVADEVVKNIESAEEQIDEVDEKATAAQEVAAATANYFFADEDGTHVASVEGDATTGFNTLGTSTGFAIRNGEDTMSAWSANAVEFYDEEGNTIASFGDTVTLGDDSKAHAEIDFNSLTLYDTTGTGKVFEVGDMRDASGVATLTESFTLTNSQTTFTISFPPVEVTSVKLDGTAVSYTVSGQTVTLTTPPTPVAGQVVEITFTTSAAVNSLTFGARTGNTGGGSVVLGNCEASGKYAIAEGYNTVASGEYSHAEGYNTVASGDHSHAQGVGTVARGLNQTVLGSYNVPQGQKSVLQFTDYAVIVGAGTDQSLVNAATLNWNGDLWTRGDITNGSGENLSDLGRFSFASGMQTDNSVNFGDGANTTRVGVFGNATRKIDVTATSDGVRYDLIAYAGRLQLYDTTNGANMWNMYPETARGNTLDAVGTIRDQSTVDTKTVTSGASYVDMNATLPLDKGAWIIVASLEFAANGTGRRGAAIRNGTNVIQSSRVMVPAVSGSQTRIQTIAIVYPTDTTNYTVGVVQNSGSSLSVSLWSRAIKIG